jgi:hypothetical protein
MLRQLTCPSLCFNINRASAVRSELSIVTRHPLAVKGCVYPHHCGCKASAVQFTECGQCTMPLALPVSLNLKANFMFQTDSANMYSEGSMSHASTLTLAT